MFKDQESKNKLIKKFFQRRFKSRSRHVFATYQELNDSFIIFLFNNMNQLIKKDEDKESEIKRLNTIMLFSKTFIFFQEFKQAKDRFNIKIDIKNFVSFHFYDREFFEQDSHQIVFINKKKFLTKIKINFQMTFDDVKNIIMYFLKIQRDITRFIIQYNFLRNINKALKKKSNQIKLSSIIFEDSNTIVNLQAQLIINQKLFQK